MADETRFTVAIHLGNAAMRQPADVARALRRIADRLELETPTGVHETIHDENGNDVGRWKLGYADRPGYAPPIDEDEAAAIAERLEELRAALRAESMSWSELADLQGLADHIAPGDLELLEAAGVPEEEALRRR